MMKQIFSRRLLPAALKMCTKHKRSIATGQILNRVFTDTGAVMPRPRSTGIIGYIGLTAAIGFGLSAGAHLSKNIASFLEENELFVPSDDEEDD